MLNNFVKKRLEKMKHLALSRNEFDYKRIMKEIETKLNHERQMKLRDRRIIQKNKQQEEKLNEMNVFRLAQVEERAKKIKQKLNTERVVSPRLSQVKSFPKVHRNKYNLVLQAEKNFSEETAKDIHHRINSFTLSRSTTINEIKKKFEKINQSAQTQTNKYNENYEKQRKQYEDDYQKKKISQFNIAHIMKEYSERKKMKKLKNYEEHLKEVKDKQAEMLEEKAKKDKETLKRIFEHQNRKHQAEMFRSSDKSKSINRVLNNEKIFGSMRKNNYDELNRQRLERNEILLQKEYDLISYVSYSDIESEKTRQKLFRESITLQEELFKKMTAMEKFIKKVGRENILNKSPEEKIHLFYEEKRKEREKQERKESNA